MIKIISPQKEEQLIQLKARRLSIFYSENLSESEAFEMFFYLTDRHRYDHCSERAIKDAIKNKRLGHLFKKYDLEEFKKIKL